MDNWLSFILAVVDIIVTLYLAIIVSKGVTQERYQREFLIREIDKFRDELKFFIQQVSEGLYLSKEIQGEFKRLGMMLRVLHNHLVEIYEYSELSEINSQLLNLNKWITDLEEYNENYDRRFIPTGNVRLEILSSYYSIDRVLVSDMLCINSLSD